MFGCDPELFACYYEGETCYAISPVSLEKEYGLKPLVNDFKHPTYFENGNGKVIMDGVAFEINLFKPYKYASDMFEDVLSIWGDFNDYLKRKINFRTIALPCIKFDHKKFWTEEVDFNEKALQGFIFGCDRSFNARSNEPMEFVDARYHEYRYGGGHIHFSDKILADNILQAVRVMDLLIGTYYMSQSHYKEEEIQRSKLYGRPGSFRPQEYKDGTKGVEYRTCSNNWLNLNTEQFAFVETLQDKVLQLLTDNNRLVKAIMNYQDAADKAIETADFKKCNEIYQSILEI